MIKKLILKILEVNRESGLFVSMLYAVPFGLSAIIVAAGLNAISQTIDYERPAEVEGQCKIIE